MSALPQVAPETPLVLREDRTGVATLTLNRPAQRNALSVALMAALQDELDRLKDDASIKAVVIAGAGPGFCGGHDLKEMRANPGRQAARACRISYREWCRDRELSRTAPRVGLP